MVIDMISGSIKFRFAELKYEANFDFLNLTLKKKSDEECLRICQNLQEVFTMYSGNTLQFNIVVEELYRELTMCRRPLKEDVGIIDSVKDIIKNDLVNVYPNTYVALCITSQYQCLLHLGNNLFLN